jgi:hypothetical protein
MDVQGQKQVLILGKSPVKQSSGKPSLDRIGTIRRKFETALAPFSAA